ncbi:putative GntR family transcriptional regulator [Gordonia araii NBRC 100433]|uniref:Putative GntR family transcriptional regulator n=1 Tax=Gordonia araii NBRC 100433 TaxID=1073574 RepID=G7H6S2_9ACTN|nr:GntR family transcriptional regulator [Gordonia araii]NNG98634.1 GntR family transcriptional regulator [Gordonia araii NBRC 100433]GAB11547.1 putative GntR family transcriptional regulator [Gordonia araii NBRC 100433]
MDDRRPSRSHIVYRALRDDLMNGVLSYEDRLGEEKLAERYDVSRTPVREALARLLADGLVERRDSGLYPHRPRLDTLNDFYEARTMLELGAMDLVAAEPGRRHRADLLAPEVARWKTLHRRPPEPDAGFVSADEQFHLTLLTAAGNAALPEALALINTRIRPVRMFDYLTHDRMVATIGEHIAIGEAALDGDLVVARDLLVAHIGASREVVAARAAQAAELAQLVRATRA